MLWLDPLTLFRKVLRKTLVSDTLVFGLRATTLTMPLRSVSPTSSRAAKLTSSARRHTAKLQNKKQLKKASRSSAASPAPTLCKPQVGPKVSPKRKTPAANVVSAPPDTAQPAQEPTLHTTEPAAMPEKQVARKSIKQLKQLKSKGERLSPKEEKRLARYAAKSELKKAQSVSDDQKVGETLRRGMARLVARRPKTRVSI